MENEMINNVAEGIKEIPVKEMFDDATEYIRTVETPKTIALTILYSALGVGAYEVGKWGVKKVWRFGAKVVNSIKDRHNERRAAKAKIVEGTDCTVEETK